MTGVTIVNVEDSYEAVPILLDRGAAKVVITLGENGAVVATQEDPTPRHVPSKEVKPLDTTVRNTIWFISLSPLGIFRTSLQVNKSYGKEI